MTSSQVLVLRVSACLVTGVVFVLGGLAMSYVHWSVAKESGPEFLIGMWVFLSIAACGCMTVGSIAALSAGARTRQPLWSWIGLAAQGFVLLGGIVLTPASILVLVPLCALNATALLSRTHDHDASNCIRCGYCQAGLPGDICPECGQETAIPLIDSSVHTASKAEHPPRSATIP